MTRIIHSFARFATVAMLLTAFGLSAAAQDTLPLRRAAGQPAGTRVLPVLEQYAPADMSEIRTYSPFTWNNIGAVKYKLVFTETATGAKHALTVNNAACSEAVCSVLPHQMGFFAQVKDGMVLTWQVKANTIEGKVKSTLRTVTVDEVITPSLADPVDGAMISYHTTLKWSNANAVNDYFHVVMIDVQTGAKALNQFLDSASCAAECSIAPRYLTNKLVPGHSYQWFVKATGYAGETAKSEKRTVVIQ